MQEVALYMCIMTCFSPAVASNVFFIRSARAGVRTSHQLSSPSSSYLYPNIIRDLITIEQLPTETKIRITSSGIRNLYLLEANLH
jgi:hypothetical protein